MSSFDSAARFNQKQARHTKKQQEAKDIGGSGEKNAGAQGRVATEAFQASGHDQPQQRGET